MEKIELIQPKIELPGVPADAYIVPESNERGSIIKPGSFYGSETNVQHQINKITQFIKKVGGEPIPIKSEIIEVKSKPRKNKRIRKPKSTINIEINGDFGTISLMAIDILKCNTAWAILLEPDVKFAPKPGSLLKINTGEINTVYYPGFDFILPDGLKLITLVLANDYKS